MKKINLTARRLGKLHARLTTAPAGAVFVCGTFSAVETTKKLAATLSRDDVTVYHVSELADLTKLAKHYQSTRVFFDEEAQDPAVGAMVVSRAYALKSLVRAARATIPPR